MSTALALLSWNGSWHCKHGPEMAPLLQERLMVWQTLSWYGLWCCKCWVLGSFANVCLGIVQNVTFFFPLDIIISLNIYILDG